MDDSRVRLQKFLAHAGLGSRRSCEEIIAERRVSVNGATVEQPGTTVNPHTDIVEVDGKTIVPETLKIYLFNKPSNVLTTLSEPDGRRCVGDFVRKLPVRVYPVGRLDYDVVGLVVLTNDGDYANRMLHPKYEVPRIYEARVCGEVNEQVLSSLTRGLALDGDLSAAKWVEVVDKPSKQTTKRLGAVKGGEAVLRVCVAEGSKHFVKRLLEAAGVPVQKLARVQFGPFLLDDLEPGGIREVSFLGL